MATGVGNPRTTIWCKQCARAEGLDGVFHRLRDRKTGREYDRQKVQLLTPSGPYDRDVDGRGEP